MQLMRKACWRACLDTHVHARFLQIHVKTGNLGFHHPLRHALRGSAHVQCIAIEKCALPSTLAMGFQHVDGLDGVLGLLTICVHQPRVFNIVVLAAGAI